MIVKNVEKKESNNISFQVEVDKSEFEDAVNSAYLKNKKKITVPGFRKGKAPRMVIEGMYGANVFYDDAIEEISPKAFEYAVKEENLKTVGRPNITDADVNDDKALTLSFETALYPEVTLGQYKGIEAPRQEINITDADVDAYIEEIRKRNGRQVTVDRAAKLGDIAVIDYDGYLDGEQFDGGKAEGTRLELGSGQFVPGFEEQVVGMKAGEEKDIDITFPENYHEGLAGKAVVFKVKVHEVIETELPAVDDEFAKDVSEFDNLPEYKKAIMEQLIASRTQVVDEDFGYNVMQKAVENMTCDVPEAMIEERMSVMIN
ncbi:MAG: trigger factor, partial [Oscillospiraceae bacterium]